MMIAAMDLADELRSLIAELRKHNASHDSILLHALMHNRKSEKPWPDDDVRRFIRSCDSAVPAQKKPQADMSAYNIVVRSETAGETEIKDFDAIVRERSEASAKRQKIFHEATAPQRLVRRPTWTKKDIERATEKSK